MLERFQYNGLLPIENVNQWLQCTFSTGGLSLVNVWMIQKHVKACGLVNTRAGSFQAYTKLEAGAGVALEY